MSSLSGWFYLTIAEVLLAVAFAFADRVTFFRTRKYKIIAKSVIYALPFIATYFPLLQTVHRTEHILLTTVILNITIVTGIIAIVRAVRLTKQSLAYDIPLSTLPLGLLVVGYLFNLSFTNFIGGPLLLVYCAYILLEQKEYEHTTEPVSTEYRIPVKRKVLLGIVSFILFISGGVLLAQGLLLAVIGSESVLSGGTALLISVFIAIPSVTQMIIDSRQESTPEDMIDSLIGSNLLLMFGILGIELLIFMFPPIVSVVQIAILGGVSAIFVLVAHVGKRYWISRPEGIVLCIAGAVALGLLAAL